MAIPNATKTNHHIGDILEDIPMGVRSEDFAHLASVLDNLYKNPVLAVLREYSTNAWDSHVDAGNPNPIEVTLPTDAKPELVIQDFGLGMSIDDIRETYSNYGASTKRGTNAVAGQLGLGSKSGLSYAEAFTITAVRNGVKVVAMSTKDEYGVGVIKVLDTLGTDDPNGVRITIPVKNWDIPTFNANAKLLYSFWSPGSVLVNGEAPATSLWEANALRLDDWGHTLLIAPESGLHTSYVVMGNVPYAVDDLRVGGRDRRFVAQLNIGDVDFTPSREELRHTPHTDKTLTELREWIADHYERAVKRQMEQAPTRWAETQIKVLWMDKGLTLRSPKGDSIWTYEPNTWGHRKASASPYYQVQGLAQRSGYIAITHFPLKNLSTPTRERLREFANNLAVTAKPTFIVLPESAPAGMLDGRPLTYSWAEVVAATSPAAAAPGAPKVKRPKVETLYEIMHADPMTADQLSKVSGKVLMLFPDQHARHGTLGATVIRLRSSAQVARILRYVPHAEEYNVELQRRMDAAKKGITQQDREIAAARALPRVFDKLVGTALDDPELVTALALRVSPDTATMVEAEKFGVPIVVDTGSTRHMTTKFFNRYPLLDALNNTYYGIRNQAEVDDTVLYLNTKFAEISA